MREVWDALSVVGLEPGGFILSCARVLPFVLLIPGWGLRWWPLSLRLAVGAVLALVLTPVAAAGSAVPTSDGWNALAVAALDNALAGVPVALGAAGLLWAVSMAGGLYDMAVLPGGAQHTESGTVQDAGAPAGLTAVFSLATLVAFFQLGGPARLVSALQRVDVASAAPAGVIQAAVQQLLAAIELAVGVAAPALVVAATVNLVVGLARGTFTQTISDGFSVLRPVIILAFFAVLFERTLEDIAAALDSVLPR